MPTERGFNSCWYPYDSVAAAARASSLNCSCAPSVKVLPVVVDTSEPLNKESTTLNADAIMMTMMMMMVVVAVVVMMLCNVVVACPLGQYRQCVYCIGVNESDCEANSRLAWCNMPKVSNN